MKSIIKHLINVVVELLVCIIPCLQAVSAVPVFLPLNELDLAWLEQPASWILLAPLHPTNTKALFTSDTTICPDYKRHLGLHLRRMLIPGVDRQL